MVLQMMLMVTKSLVKVKVKMNWKNRRKKGQIEIWGEMQLPFGRKHGCKMRSITRVADMPPNAKSCEMQ